MPIRYGFIVKLSTLNACNQYFPGNSWKKVAGPREGQTQVDTPLDFTEGPHWCHPIDIQFVSKGLAGKSFCLCSNTYNHKMQVQGSLHGMVLELRLAKDFARGVSPRSVWPQ